MAVDYGTQTEWVILFLVWVLEIKEKKSHFLTRMSSFKIDIYAYIYVYIHTTHEICISMSPLTNILTLISMKGI